MDIISNHTVYHDNQWYEDYSCDGEEPDTGNESYYGHREDTNSPSDSYTPTRATGNVYHMFDKPGIMGARTPWWNEDVYKFDYDFRTMVVDISEGGVSDDPDQIPHRLVLKDESFGIHETFRVKPNGQIVHELAGNEVPNA